MHHHFSTFAWGMPGMGELLIIGIVVLLLFGTRIPTVMRSLGQGITEFKKGVKDGATDAPAADAQKLT